MCGNGVTVVVGGADANGPNNRPDCPSLFRSHPNRPAGKQIRARRMVRRFGSLSTARRLSVAHLSGRQQPATAMILIDLENVGCRALQSSMDSLRSLCARTSVSLRTYTASEHGMAAMATDTVASTAKSAVDVRIAFDIGRSSMQAPGSRFLVVTKDHFGRALADVPSASTDHATLDSPLPSHWRRLLGVPSLAQLVEEAQRTKAAQAQLAIATDSSAGDRGDARAREAVQRLRRHRHDRVRDA